MHVDLYNGGHCCASKFTIMHNDMKKTQAVLTGDCWPGFFCILHPFLTRTCILELVIFVSLCFMVCVSLSVLKQIIPKRLISKMSNVSSSSFVHFLVFGSVQYIKLTYLSFRSHVKIASCIVTRRGQSNLT